MVLVRDQKKASRSSYRRTNVQNQEDGKVFSGAVAGRCCCCYCYCCCYCCIERSYAVAVCAPHLVPLQFYQQLLLGLCTLPGTGRPLQSAAQACQRRTQKQKEKRRQIRAGHQNDDESSKETPTHAPLIARQRFLLARQLCQPQPRLRPDLCEKKVVCSQRC